MKATARDLARRVLLRVEQGAYATLALSGELQRAGLSPPDRALCTELVYGTLKQKLRLDHALSAYAPQGLDRLDAGTLWTLRLGAYQILHLRVPAHASVHDAVEAIKRGRSERLAGFANALLRRLAREGEPPLLGADTDAAALSIRYSLPEWLVKDALCRLGQTEAESYFQALNVPPPLWLRLNALRGPRDMAIAALAGDLGPRPLSPSERLPEAVRTTAQDLFTGAAYGEGWFTAQDLGAQLVTRLLLCPGAPLVPGPILDACAGIGGKSTHLAALLAHRPDGDRDIDAADRSDRKLELCADHAHRLGATRVRTVAADLTLSDVPLRPGYAAILLDAPCTGLGVLRRHPEARWRVLPDKIAQLAALQRRLLSAVAERLLPGGLLCYSVCTYTDEEGPAQIASFLKERPDLSVVPPSGEGPAAEGPMWTGLIDGQGAMRTWPQRDDADAFYAVRLRRKE